MSRLCHAMMWFLNIACDAFWQRTLTKAYDFTATLLTQILSNLPHYNNCMATEIEIDCLKLHKRAYKPCFFSTDGQIDRLYIWSQTSNPMSRVDHCQAAQLWVI